ncbi:hypothetical protein AC249_AIPGENE4728 [Exaiptasia diaphana]|nr:hypothetical protein AC249_AIPGENE4728 [Exaiptasia diaphana]
MNTALVVLMVAVVAVEHSQQVQSTITFPALIDHCLKKCNELWQACITICGPIIDDCSQCSTKAESCRNKCFNRNSTLKLKTKRTLRNIISTKQRDSSLGHNQANPESERLPNEIPAAGRIVNEPSITFEDEVLIETEPSLT